MNCWSRHRRRRLLRHIACRPLRCRTEDCSRRYGRSGIIGGAWRLHDRRRGALRRRTTDVFLDQLTHARITRSVGGSAEHDRMCLSLRRTDETRL
jgi:hypothetical protein